MAIPAGASSRGVSSMRLVSKNSGVRFLAVVLAASAAPAAYAQQQTSADSNIIVTGPAPSDLTAGPEVKGGITARDGDGVKVTTADGTSAVIAITDATRVKTSGGLFGGQKLEKASLLNGLPVTITTLQPRGGGEL